MSKRSIELIALTFALTFAGACKGRTAAWEEKADSKNPEPTASADGSSKMAAGMAAWEGRLDKAKAVERSRCGRRRWAAARAPAPRRSAAPRSRPRPRTPSCSRC
ncbi:MAG: hypothetical protein HC927_03605 [Deltaproteobacteria bacterium]|nr:hypothetical protein [Deltaproteobacteria bacterium]